MADPAKLSELLGETVEGEEGVSYGEALVRSRGVELRVRILGSAWSNCLGFSFTLGFSRHFDLEEKAAEREEEETETPEPAGQEISALKRLRGSDVDSKLKI